MVYCYRKDISLLANYIYEFNKGIRNLVLHTIHIDSKEEAVNLLKRNSISYIFYKVTEEKINLFFGNKECLKVIQSFGKKSLNEFSLEEDFILGTMLGYDSVVQCKRYISRLKTFDIKEKMYV